MWLRIFFLAVLVFPAMGQQLPSAAVSHRLSLREAMEMALTNNLDVRIERLNPLIERARIRYALGSFDPSFNAGVTYEDSQIPLNSREFVAIGAPTNLNARLFVEENWRMEAGVFGRSPLGTEYGLSMRTAELRNPINRQIPPSLFYPEYTSFAGLTLRQPLLKGFGLKANLAEVRFARKGLEMAQGNEKLQVQQSIASVMTNYYDLVFALENLKVKEETIRLYQELERANRQRLEQGVMSAIDVQQAQVAVSVGEEERLLAQTFYVERQNALKSQVYAEANTSEQVLILPVDKLPVQTAKYSREELIQEGFENRVDYQNAIAESGREEIRLQFARNQRWPRLDLQGTYGINGLGSSYNDSYDRIFDEQGPAWTLGVTVSIPLGNVQGRAGYDIAKKRREQSILNIKRVENRIVLDVDTAASHFESSLQRLQTSRQTRALAEETLNIEMRRLSQGQTSSFNVLQFQRDLSQAKTRELQARADLQKNLILLRIAAGTLMKEEGYLVGAR